MWRDTGESMVMSRNSIKTRTKEGVRGGEKEQKE